MPEGVEVELYRRVAHSCVQRVVSRVHAPDDWYLKRETTPSNLSAHLLSQRVTNTTRHGKLLLIHFSNDAVLGLRFGMTGRLIIDGTAGIDDLLYTSNEYRPEWVRFALAFEGGGLFEVVDPRRLGGVELEPELPRGVDIGALTNSRLHHAFANARGPVKAALMDQERVAGIGNMLADEILWRTGVAPTRPVPNLAEHEIDALAKEVRATYNRLLRKGGSHLGDHVPQRHRDGRCDAHDRQLQRATIGGRTTYWCPAHQT